MLSVVLRAGCACGQLVEGLSFADRGQYRSFRRWNLPWPNVHLLMVKCPACISSPTTARSAVLAGRQRFTALKRCTRALAGSGTVPHRTHSGTASHSWSALSQRWDVITDLYCQLRHQTARKPVGWRCAGACLPGPVWSRWSEHSLQTPAQQPGSSTKGARACHGESHMLRSLTPVLSLCLALSLAEIERERALSLSLFLYAWPFLSSRDLC